MELRSPQIAGLCTTDGWAHVQAKGNAAFSSGQFEEAIDYFSQAIEQTPSNHVLFSNRSACHVGQSSTLSVCSDCQDVTCSLRVLHRPAWATSKRHWKMPSRYEHAPAHLSCPSELSRALDRH